MLNTNPLFFDIFASAVFHSLSESPFAANRMKPPPLVTPNSDGTSFITARSKNTNASSVFASYHLSPSHDDKDADEEDSIDYDLLHRDLLGKDDNDNQAKSLIKDNHDTESVATIKPSDIKPTIALTSSLPPALTALSSKIAEPITINKKKRKKHRRRTNKSLLWKKTGSLFVTHGLTDHQPESSIPPAIGETIKRGPVVCMRTVTDRLGSEPTRYKASKESKYSLLTEEWKQVELVLTRSYISTYSLSVKKKSDVLYIHFNFLQRHFFGQNIDWNTVFILMGHANQKTLNFF